jgi:hypothetical protein
MLKKQLSLVLIIALAFALCGITAFARNPSDPPGNANMAETSAKSAPAATTKAKKSNERLRADMLRLVADAKAGKVTPAARPQLQPAKSNNLSKGAKIAIGVGIAVVVLAIIVKYQRDHLFDNFNLRGLSL